jgi:hypothetical protein
VCRAPDRAATCEGIGRCPLDRPICRWSAKSTRCVDWKSFESETDEDRHALRCTRPNDCGSEARCCTNAIWDSTACLTNCDSANNGEVCASDADCTTFLGKPMKGKCVSVKDGEIATLPAWLKVCSYE